MPIRLSKTHVDKALRDVAAGAPAYDLIDNRGHGGGDGRR